MAMTQLIKRGVDISRTWEQLTAYWGSLLQNLVKTFIAVFYVPPYRPEWGKYSSWTESKIVKKRKTRRKMPRTCNKYDHDHSECERVILNVAGTIFETQLRSLNKYPDSLLGNPARRLRFYDPRTKEYYFDRHASSFEAIFHFFQSGGILQRPFSIPMETFCEECRFYDLGEEAITKLKKEEGYAVGDDQKVLPESLCKRKVWVLFEYPESSRQARVVTVFSVYVIVLSIVIFCTESVPSLKFKTLLEDKLPNIDDPFYFIETACVLWFCLELAVRFVTSPDKQAFLTSVMNIIDFLSIIPYFVALVGRISPVTSSKSAQAYISLVRVIRLVRVFRIFKLSRHSKGLQILGLTLRASIRELGLLMFFLIIGVIIFSSAIYFAEEKTPNGNFTSIPTSFWWGVITMTTVGYGDVVPKSTFGKLVGSLCAIAGVLTIALPVPVIVSNFNYFYHRETERATEIDGVNPHEVMQCPFLSGKYESLNSNPSKTVTILGEQTQTKTRIHSNASILKSLKRARSGSQTAIPRLSD